MTGTPVLLPDPPEHEVDMDALLDICRTMQLTGGVFLEAEFTAPWCVTSQVAPEDCSPFMPPPLQLIAYHYVTAGRLVLQTEVHAPVSVQAGEIILMPRNDGHVLGSTTNLRPVNAHFLIQPAGAGGMARIVYGGGGERTQILCGYLGTNTPNAAICGILPRMLKIGVEEGASGSWIESSFRFAAHQLAEGRIESPAVLGKLAELLFVEAVRRYARSLPPEANGWLAGPARSSGGAGACPAPQPYDAPRDHGGACAGNRIIALRVRREIHEPHRRAANALPGELANAGRRPAIEGLP